MSKGFKSSFDTVEAAIADIAAGKLVIVTDDESRENEGDLIMAAARVKPDQVNMMIRHCSGIICVPTTDHHLKRLGINPMVPQNRESHRTDFTVSVDAAEGITTGISAYDRTATIKILSDSQATPDMLVQPGHVFPLRARQGGVLERAGHTEAAVDLAVLAGLHPSGVLSEILNEDGTCARLPELVKFKKRFGLHLISISDLIQYRHRREKLVRCIARRPFSSAYGEFELHVFANLLDSRHHFALTMGSLDKQPTLVRVHSENLLSDVFQAQSMSSHHSLVASMERIAKEKHGVILYMAQSDSGLNIALLESGKGSKDDNLAAAPMDSRARGIGSQILAALGLRKIRLLSSTPGKVIALDGYGLEIVERIPLD